jgi:ribonucleotide reductase beta subunit family protein with ferritin-like domain
MSSSSRNQLSIEEPLSAEEQRLTLYPIRHEDIWRCYKEQLASFWTPEEIDFSKDWDDWKRLNPGEQHFVKQILAFFAGADAIVGLNIMDSFTKQVRVLEAQTAYIFQAAMEGIHCCHGSTMILTSKGYVRIADVVDETLDVWNGEEWSTTTVRKTGEGSKLLRVVLSNGIELRCTPQHKWFIQDASDTDADDSWVVYAEDLKPGDVIAKFRFPVLDIPDPDDPGSVGSTIVPLNHSISTKLRWLESVAEEHSEGMRIQSLDLDFMRQVQLMLSTLGIHSVISRNTIYEEEHPFRCYIKNAIDLSWMTVLELKQLGFAPGLKPGLQATQEPDHPITVIDVFDEEERADTYCFNEPKRHSGVFNGVLTGQSEVYSIMVDTYIKDPQEKALLLKDAENLPVVGDKIRWARTWAASDAPLGRRLLAFAIVEGIFFSSAFCAIYWLKQRSILPGLTKSNEFIARDEGMHVDFACLLYSKVEQKLSSEEVRDMIMDAVLVEKRFITESIPCSLIGMNATLMTQYIEYVADRLCVQLGYAKLYGAKNPFPFMVMLGMETRNNIMETVTTNYQKAAVLNQSRCLEILEDF